VLTLRKAVTSKGVTKTTTEHRRLGLSDFGEKHEWFDLSDSDEDEASGDENASNASHQLSDQAMTWIANLRAEDEIFDGEISDGYRFWPNSPFGFDRIGGDYIMDGERLHESEAKEPTRALYM
jgi:hypothetical protein